MLRHLVCLFSFAAAAVAPALADDLALSTPSAETVAPGICSSQNPFAIVENLNGMVAPCLLAPRTVAVETVYLQNASRVGGTALAAYPLVELRAGVVPGLQFTLHLPSAIAQSVPGGGGAFPVTHFGYGLSYALAQSPRGATALVTEVLPPDSRFAPQHAQARYTLGVASTLALTRRWTLDAQAVGTSSATRGFGLVEPALDLAATYAPSARTQLVTGLGSRILARRGAAQMFGDVGVNHAFNRKLVFTVGVGTTFNVVGNAKPHYLASGFSYRP